MTQVDLVVIGGGNMGAALISGLLAAGRAPQSMAVVEVVAARRSELQTMFPGVLVGTDVPLAEGAVIAVKPPDAAAACADALRAGVTRILSIAAGVPIAALEAASGSAAVIRAMPNTPALVGQGASAIAGGFSATADDLDWAEQILGAVGAVVRVPESQLDAVTGWPGAARPTCSSWQRHSSTPVC